MQENRTGGPPTYRCALAYILKNPLPRYTDPTTYLKASGEMLALIFVICWGIGILAAPDMIASNPLNAALGYYSLCVGFDAWPANRIGLVLFIPTAYLGIRYVWTDTIRAVLERDRLTTAQYRWTWIANGGYALSMSLFALVFVESPFEDHWVHSYFFIQLIFLRFVVVGANFYEAEQVTMGSRVFMWVYGIISCVLPFLYLAAYQGYAQNGEVLIPWPIVAAFDYGWFLCLVLTTRFLPAAPCILTTWELDQP